MNSPRECRHPVKQGSVSYSISSPATRIRCRNRLRSLLRSLNIFRKDGSRRPWRFKCATAGVAVLWVAISASAIDPHRTVSQYLRDSWGVEKGFPGSISAIAQTPDGYLWIGSDKGLIRFDGLYFQKFERASPSSLSNDAVQALKVDRQGNLWVLLR